MYGYLFVAGGTGGGTTQTGALCSATHTVPQNGLSFSVPTGGSTNTQNVLTCAAGYRSSQSNNIMTCDQNGVWTNKPTCVREYNVYL